MSYGNYTAKPQVKIEARAIPGSEDYFLVSWSDQKLPPHCRATEEQNPRHATGLYLLDAFGNLELLYRDPDISSASPIPLAPRPRPPVIAASRAPSRITPGPEGSWPLRFGHLVKPVLDRHCVECHRPGTSDAQAAKLDLTPARAYTTLLEFGGSDLKRHAFERDRLVPGEGTAANSRLWKLLSQAGGHEGVKCDNDSVNRVVTWLDTYAQRTGHFSDEQEEQLAASRRECAALLQENTAQ